MRPFLFLYMVECHSKKCIFFVDYLQYFWSHNMLCIMYVVAMYLYPKVAMFRLLVWIRNSRTDNAALGRNHEAYIRWYVRNCCAREQENRYFRGENTIGDCSRSNQMLLTDKITENAPYVRTYF